MRRTLPFLLVLSGCGGVGWLDGAGFEIADAVYERESPADDARMRTTIVLSDAPDLCGGSNAGGHSELRIQSFESGSATVELVRYSDACEVEATERAEQTWVEVVPEGHGKIGLDLVFRTSKRSASGSVKADWCELPKDSRVLCRK